MPDPLVSLREIDLTRLCELNNQFGAETSMLTEAEISRLISMEFYGAAVVGGSTETPDAMRIDAMLIAFDQAASYDNPNFDFFRSRHARFVYIDRMITATHAQRRGLGRRLYEDLFVKARTAGHGIVGCEVNLDPPNPGSDAFHERLGFAEVGQATLQNGKTVRYLEFHLDRKGNESCFAGGTIAGSKG
jgi:predicted GNAT superfamily acetyltransferase